MTLTLILTRHAKSSWEDRTLEDFDRPLNSRGRRAAAELGDWLASRGYLPDLALVSPARRTRETLERMQPPLGPVPLREEPRLYEADAETLLSVLREQVDAATLLLVAHNPGIGDLAEALAAIPPRHEQFHRYPTGATTVMRLPIAAWSAVAAGVGDVVDFVVPRELTA